MPALQKEMQASSTSNFRYFTCLLDKGHINIDKLLYPGVFYKEKLQKNEIKYIKNCTNRVILYTLH